MAASVDIRVLLGIRWVRSTAHTSVQTLLCTPGRILDHARVRISDQERGSSAAAIVFAMDDSASGIAALGASAIPIMATTRASIPTGGGIHTRQTMPNSAN